MTIDEYGIVRDEHGIKVAVFRDLDVGRRLIELAKLLDEDQATVIAKSGQSVRLQRVVMRRVRDES